MKTNALCLFVVLAMPAGASDIGLTSMFIGRNKTTGVNAPITDHLGNRLAGERYRVMIYGGTSVERLMPVYDSRERVISDVGLMTGNDAGYYRFNDYLLVPRFDNQGHSWIQVRAWDSTLGQSYEEVVALGVGGYGQSTAFVSRGQLDSSLIDPPLAMIGLKPFSIAAIVPEPSTWALLGCGSGVLVWRCRRRTGV